MYKKRRILHRDISPGNVLVVNEPTDPTEPLCDDLGDMCFSEYLLDVSNGQGRSGYVIKFDDVPVD